MKGFFKTSIHKYYTFQFLHNLAFFSPVIMLFWQSHGLSLTQIMLLQSIYSIGVVILELPTGAFADKFGKRKSLILGSVFWALGFLWYWLSSNFWQFAIGELIVGVGSAFISGADRAYLHEFLREMNQGGDFKKNEGKARGIDQIAQAIGSITGGFIGSISLSLTLFATSISAFFGLLVGISFPKLKESEHIQRPSFGEIISESISLVRGHKRLLWLTLFYASFNGLIWPLNFYSQPVLQSLNIPIIYFGVIFFAFNLIAGLGSSLTYQFERIAKKRSFLILSATVVVSLFLISYINTIYIFPLWSLFLALLFINQTIISHEVLQIVPEGNASTILSFQSVLRRIFYAVVGPILGIASDYFGLHQSLMMYSGFIFLVLGGLLIVEKKFESRTQT